MNTLTTTEESKNYWEQGYKSYISQMTPFESIMVEHAHKIDEAVFNAMPAWGRKIYRSKIAFRIPILTFLCKWIFQIRIERWNCFVMSETFKPNYVTRIYRRGKLFDTV